MISMNGRIKIFLLLFVDCADFKKLRDIIYDLFLSVNNF